MKILHMHVHVHVYNVYVQCTCIYIRTCTCTCMHDIVFVSEYVFAYSVGMAFSLASIERCSSSWSHTGLIARVRTLYRIFIHV